MDIPDYFDIIKEPMDLSTVDTKLRASVYSTTFEFAETFLERSETSDKIPLVFKNRLHSCLNLTQALKLLPSDVTRSTYSTTHVHKNAHWHAPMVRHLAEQDL